MSSTAYRGVSNVSSQGHVPHLPFTIFGVASGVPGAHITTGIQHCCSCGQCCIHHGISLQTAIADAISSCSTGSTSRSSPLLIVTWPPKVYVAAEASLPPLAIYRSLPLCICDGPRRQRCQSVFAGRSRIILKPSALHEAIEAFVAPEDCYYRHPSEPS